MAYFPLTSFSRDVIWDQLLWVQIGPVHARGGGYCINWMARQPLVWGADYVGRRPVERGVRWAHGEVKWLAQAHWESQEQQPGLIPVQYSSPCFVSSLSHVVVVFKRPLSLSVPWSCLCLSCASCSLSLQGHGWTQSRIWAGFYLVLTEGHSCSIEDGFNVKILIQQAGIATLQFTRKS